MKQTVAGLHHCSKASFEPQRKSGSVMHTSPSLSSNSARLDTASNGRSSNDYEAATEAPQTIVMAVDDCDGATLLVAAAAHASRGAPSVFHMIHVLRASLFDHARVGVPATPPSAIENAREHFGALVLAAEEECRARVIGHFSVGDPEVEVSRLCSELNADLLVIGRRDRMGLERLLLGSTSEGLVRKAVCPVLIVRQKNAR
jgi:nucleotide-binding universal stress UspA family protein